MRVQNFLMEFHEKLKDLISNQSAAARLVGVTPGTIRNWIEGKHQPPFETIRLFADHFSVPFAWLVDPTDSRDLAQVRREEFWVRTLRRLSPEEAEARVTASHAAHEPFAIGDTSVDPPESRKSQQGKAEAV